MLSANSIGVFYAFVHFSVELACFYFIYSRFSQSPLWWGIAFLYDALAFLPQSIIGIVKDRFPSLKVGVLGAVMIVCALFVPFDIAALVIISLGNALVHIEGAFETLRGTDGKLTPAGVFVGGGSFGVVMGQLLGASFYAWGNLLTASFMVVSGVLMLVIPSMKKHSGGAENFNDAADVSVSVLVLLVIVAVAVRSYIGYAIPTAWNKSKWQTVLLFFSMGIGKALGGILSDYFGSRKTAIFSLAAALPFLVLGNNLMTVSLIGVALFSMTMPVTLSILVSRFKKAPGLSFGITTLGLFLGALPSFFVQPKGLVANIITVIVLTLVAIICLHYSLNKECR